MEVEALSAAQAVSLTALCATGAWVDVRERRIPNALTVGGLLLALLLRLPEGAGSLGAGLAAALLAFAAGLPLFLVGGMGGGDVKFLAMAGAFLGLERLPEGLLITVFVGGGVAAAVVTRSGRWRSVALNVRLLVAALGKKVVGGRGADPAEVPTLETPGALTVPYGIAVAAGAIAGWFLG